MVITKGVTNEPTNRATDDDMRQLRCQKCQMYRNRLIQLRQ